MAGKRQDGMGAEDGIAESSLRVVERAGGEGGGKNKIHAETCGQARQQRLRSVRLDERMIDFIQCYHVKRRRVGGSTGDDTCQALHIEPPVHTLPAVDVER